MLRLTKEREARGLSRAALARKADLNAQTVGQAELGRLLLYPVQLAKIATALNYTGAPEELLEEVGGDD